MNEFLKKYWRSILFFIVISVLFFGRVPQPKGHDIPHFDKIAHFGIFMVCVIVFSYDVKRNQLMKHPLVKFLPFILAILYGGLVEVIQGTLAKGRSADLYDFVADIIGASVGYLLFKYFSKFESLRSNS